MPTYDYFCPTNGRVVSAFHSMSVRPDNWGELCEIASIELGETEREAPVQRQLGTGIVMARRPDQLTGFGGGSCCGTDGCGD